MKNRPKKLSRGALAIALAAAFPAGSALAFQINTGSPDVEVRWDNTVRYNAGWRVNDRSASLANNPANDQAEYLFDRGEMINNRLDLISELDVAYKNKVGARVSGAAWIDRAYDSTGESHPLLQSRSTYINDRFSSYTKRYYAGPSGELLDAFAWTNLELGDTELALKVGRHAVLWGEAIFPTASGNSVAFAQAPSDGLKSATSPGANAKETAIPLNQVSATWQLAPSFSVSGLYTLEWRTSRIPEGGTYFGIADALLDGPDRLAPGIPWGEDEEGKKGDWGVNLRWRPALLDDASLGLYYRKFDDKGPSWAAQVVNLGGGRREGRSVYAKDIEVIGASIGTNIMSHAVSAEVSYRKDTPLLSASPVFAAGQDLEGARGNTWHFLANTTSLFGNSALWDTAVMVTELTYQRLDKITKNKAHFRSASTQPGTCGADTIVKGCATRDAWHLAVMFTPTWQQVLPGVDLSMPVVFQTGLKGNAATTGINEGGSVFRIGLGIDYQLRHKVDLAYTNYWGKDKSLGQSSPAGIFHSTNGALATYEDRDNITLTYSYSF